MSKELLKQIQQVAIADIVISADRLRFTTDSAVESIVTSAEELGSIQNPILLRKIRHTKDDILVLMDGGHRVEAAKRMGQSSIRAIIYVDITDEEARLIEIDMNVAGATLSPLDEALFLAERKRIYERIHPETKRGFAGNAAAQGLKKDGTPVIMGSGNKNMWRSMRMLKIFTPCDLALHSTTDTVVVEEETARKYCGMLLKAKYLRVLKKAVPGKCRATYRFVRNTGPKPPQIQNVKQVFDPNLNKVTYYPEVTL